MPRPLGIQKYPNWNLTSCEQKRIVMSQCIRTFFVTKFQGLWNIMHMVLIVYIFMISYFLRFLSFYHVFAYIFTHTTLHIRPFFLSIHSFSLTHSPWWPSWCRQEYKYIMWCISKHLEYIHIIMKNVERKKLCLLKFEERVVNLLLQHCLCEKPFLL